MPVLEQTRSKQNDPAAPARRPSRGRLPHKRSINLVSATEKKLNLLIAIPAILVILVAAALFGKFAVADRLSAVSAAEQQNDVLRSQLAAGYEALSRMDEVEERYAHFTYAGMTAEELSRADRVAVLDMIAKEISSRVRVDTWSVSGNQLMLRVTGASLQAINTAMQHAESSEIVEFCTVTTATTSETPRTDGVDGTKTEVTANVVIYLKSAAEEGE